MRDPLAAVLQVVISVTVVGAGMPALLFSLPPARHSGVGPLLAVALVVATFALQRAIWPRRD